MKVISMKIFHCLLFCTLFVIPCRGETTFFSTNFESSKDLELWKIVEPVKNATEAWIIRDKSLWRVPRTYETKAKSIIETGSPEWTNYTIEVACRSFGSTDGYGVQFYKQEDGDGYELLIYPHTDPRKAFIRLFRIVNGSPTFLKEEYYYQPETDEGMLYRYQIAVKDDEIQISNQRGEIFSISDKTFSSGKIALFCWSDREIKFKFDYIKVYETESIKNPLFVNQPYIQPTGPDEMTISWETSHYAKGKVESGLIKDGFTNTFEDEKRSIFHKIKIPNLETNSEYIYRVKCEGEITETKTFKTRKTADESFRFAVWSDNQTHYDKHKMLCDRFSEMESDFAVSIGDIVADELDYSGFNKQFFHPAEALIGKTPFHVTIGSHEQNSYWFYKYFPQPENYYSFDYGNTHFIILDTSITALYYPGSAQYNWLVDDLSSHAAGDAKWRIVFVYRPPYSQGGNNSNYDGEVNTRIWLVPIFEKLGVDLVLSGHTHNYERGELNGITYIITGGGGGKLDHFEQNWDFMNKYAAVHHGCVIEVDGDALKIKSIETESGKIIDEWSLDKSGDGW